MANVQSSTISSVVHTSTKISWSQVTTVIPPAFSRSAVISSFPGTRLFFILFRAWWTSPIVGGFSGRRASWTDMWAGCIWSISVWSLQMLLLGRAVGWQFLFLDWSHLSTQSDDNQPCFWRFCVVRRICAERCSRMVSCGGSAKWDKTDFFSITSRISFVVHSFRLLWLPWSGWKWSSAVSLMCFTNFAYFTSMLSSSFLLSARFFSSSLWNRLTTTSSSNFDLSSLSCGCCRFFFFLHRRCNLIFDRNRWWSVPIAPVALRRERASSTLDRNFLLTIV